MFSLSSKGYCKRGQICSGFWYFFLMNFLCIAHNRAFVQLPPTKKPTSVGFFVPAGHQRGGDWSTRARVRGFTRSHSYERATSLPIEKFQRGTLRSSRPRKCSRRATHLRKHVGGFNGVERKQLNTKCHLDTWFGLVRIGHVPGQ